MGTDKGIDQTIRDRRFGSQGAGEGGTTAVRERGDAFISIKKHSITSCGGVFDDFSSTSSIREVCDTCEVFHRRDESYARLSFLLRALDPPTNL